MFNNYSVGKIFSAVIIAVVFLSSFVESDARRKRRYYPEQTREKAVELMRTSPEMCTILGLEPITLDSNMVAELEAHSETLPGDIEFSDESTNKDSEGSDLVYREGAYTSQDIFSYVDKHIDELDDSQLQQLWTAYITEGEVPQYTEAGIEKRAIADAFMYWMGTPYRFGGISEKGIDCSAFVREVFRSAGFMELPRTAREQYKVGEVIEREDLEFGDLIFFKTSSYARITHVGIYLSDDLFVHASSRQGVTVSSLNSSYYSRRYRGGRRITVNDLDDLTIVESMEDIDFLKAN